MDLHFLQRGCKERTFDVSGFRIEATLCFASMVHFTVRRTGGRSWQFTYRGETVSSLCLEPATSNCAAFPPLGNTWHSLLLPSSSLLKSSQGWIFCNSLSSGLPSIFVAQLQRIQANAVRRVEGVQAEGVGGGGRDSTPFPYTAISTGCLFQNESCAKL